MSEWQPIATAPKDGTRILITCAEYFTAAKWWYHVQQDIIPAQYARTADGDPLPEGAGLPLAGRPLGWSWVPNPRAGEKVYSWWQDIPLAFAEGKTPSEGERTGEIVPTHWKPLQAPTQP